MVMTPQKEFLYLVSDSNDIQLASWRDVVAPPQFTWPINGGPGGMDVVLPRSLGAVGEIGEPDSHNDMMLSNKLSIYAIDGQRGLENTGVLIYKGDIDEYAMQLGNGTVSPVSLIPIGSILGDSWVEGPITFTATDPTNMLHYFFLNGPPGGTSYMPGITWDVTNPLVGMLHDLKIEKQKMSQVVETIRSLAGGTWFWRLSPASLFTFNHWSLFAKPDHLFYIGKHIAADTRLLKSRMPRKTRCFIYGAPAIVEVKDEEGVVTTPASPAIFAVATAPNFDPDRPRDDVLSNKRITDVASAQRIASGRLEFLNRDFFETEFIVMDDSIAPPGKGYDIESCLPGQTAALVNPDEVFYLPIWGDGGVWGDGGIWGGPWRSAFQSPFVIAQVRYNGYSISVKLQQRPLGVANEILNLADQLLLQETA